MPSTPTTSERPTPNSVLVWLSIALCLLAIGIATVYVVEPTRASAVALDVESVVAEQTPSTVPPIVVDEATAPLPTPASASGSDASDVELTGADVTATARRASGDDRPDDAVAADDLMALIGDTTSALPEPLSERPVPVALDIDSIDVTRYDIRDVGLEDDGRLEVPDETEIGWYRYGATAGRPGATVLAAHVSWNQTTGPFFELGTVEPGSQISVTLSDGTTRQYEVIERTLYDKDELPRERIWRSTGDEELVLITCGGDFNPEIRRYRQNIVVYAVPVA